MSDYALVRTRSAVSLCGPPSTMTLTRTYSVPDLTSYVRASDKYRPSWSSYYYYPYYSYRYSYPYSSYYSYTSPYYRSLYYSPYYRYGYSGYYSSPYYYSPYSWSRYYDYDYPSYYRRWYDPYYSSYMGTYRYRSWLLDSMEDGLQKGLAQFRDGTISYTQLFRNHISSLSWNQRHKDWRKLYYWDKEALQPQNYTAEWVPGFNPSREN